MPQTRNPSSPVRPSDTVSIGDYAQQHKSGNVTKENDDIRVVHPLLVGKHASLGSITNSEINVSCLDEHRDTTQPHT